MDSHPRETATVIKMLVKAGLILVGKANFDCQLRISSASYADIGSNSGTGSEPAAAKSLVTY